MFEQILTSAKNVIVFNPPAVIPGNPYKGFVAASDFVRGDALASLVGLTDGTPFNVDGGWLHYIDGEKEFYIARLPIRYGMSGASLTAASQGAGKTVTIGGQEYTVRMPTGMSVNPYSSIVTDASGGEWNQYMYPIYGGADRPAVVQWSYYTNQDLGLVEGVAQNGTISLCKDLHNSIANAYAGRGRDYYGGTTGAVITRKTVINDGAINEGNGSYGRNAYGWRPYVEKVAVAPTIVDTWENIATMPVQRRSMSAVEIGGLVYLYGGYNDLTVPQNTLHVFDPVAKTFTAKAPGIVRASHDAIAIGGKMYVFGGITGDGTVYSNDVSVYNPTNNTWSTLPTVGSAARSRHKLVINGNGFIAIGGVTAGGGLLTTMQRYDLDTLTWGTTFGNYGSQLFGLADNTSGTVYTSGGYPGAPSNLFTAITAATGAQLARAVMTSTRYGHVNFYAKNGVYVIGGVAGTPADATKVQRYTASSNTWTTLATIPWAIADNSAWAQVGNDIYIFGGSGGNFTACWKYTP